MRSVSTSAEKQKDIEISFADGIAKVWIRKDHKQVPEVEGEGSHWECEEAFMECPDSDAPDAEEVEADFEGWFEYVGEWQPPRQKNLAQLQADLEYIATMTGVELEV